MNQIYARLTVYYHFAGIKRFSSTWLVTTLGSKLDNITQHFVHETVGYKLGLRQTCDLNWHLERYALFYLKTANIRTRRGCSFLYLLSKLTILWGCYSKFQQISINACLAFTFEGTSVFFEFNLVWNLTKDLSFQFCEPLILKQNRFISFNKIVLI